ncbi:hypothetical protein FGO68_gene10372 [Halteria grandinella]|uniref:Uncharacterized protein n=1 Tax=Halteria grandinella TaxID=5974 RepID=A0A8J8NYD5_HALGN|nr:hypothetical protein FGO68_gene10372 [Halteria grandinella]
MASLNAARYVLEPPLRVHRILTIFGRNWGLDVQLLDLHNFEYLFVVEQNLISVCDNYAVMIRSHNCLEQLYQALLIIVHFKAVSRLTILLSRENIEKRR